MSAGTARSCPRGVTSRHGHACALAIGAVALSAATRLPWVRPSPDDHRHQGRRPCLTSTHQRQGGDRTPARHRRGRGRPARSRAGPGRFHVSETDNATQRLVEAGARLVAPPTRTPCDSRNARLRDHDGVQLTLVTELVAPGVMWRLDVGRRRPSACWSRAGGRKVSCSPESTSIGTSRTARSPQAVLHTTCGSPACLRAAKAVQPSRDPGPLSVRPGTDTVGRWPAPPETASPTIG